MNGGFLAVGLNSQHPAKVQLRELRFVLKAKKISTVSHGVPVIYLSP